MALALGLVRRVERRQPVLPRAARPRPFVTVGRTVLAADLEVGSSELVPPSLRDQLRTGSTETRQLSARVAADVVTLAKFDLGEELKLRAHYVEPRLTLALAPSSSGGRDVVMNAVRAHEVVSRSAPGLCPSLLAHGRVGRRVSYLVEEWVDGTPLLTSSALADAAAEILDGLARVHRGHGVTSTRPRERWGARFPERWDVLRSSGVVPDELGERVAALIADDRALRVSWTHGDLVASNVLRTPDGRVVLLDWEHSRADVLMRDAAKLHLFSASPGTTLDQVLDVLGHHAGPGAYSAAEELALAHAHLLSGYPSRRAALEGHPRANVYERQVRRQVERLDGVLDRS